MKNKHHNYEILNLIGYGLAKFDNAFIQEFGFVTKSSFFDYCVRIGLATTVGVIKNRMDLFDHFFPNHRKGWWQKGDAYIHRKILIDNLFGNEDVTEFANIVKMFLFEKYHIDSNITKIKPIVQSKFKQMQTTGLEAELYFINNFNSISLFQDGKIEDARLYGDGYDFQINIKERTFLTEIKGIREKTGTFRLTEKEYNKAKEYKSDYVITLVLNLNQYPKFKTVVDPINTLSFKEKVIQSKTFLEYQLIGNI